MRFVLNVGITVFIVDLACLGWVQFWEKPLTPILMTVISGARQFLCVPRVGCRQFDLMPCLRRFIFVRVVIRVEAKLGHDCIGEELDFAIYRLFRSGSCISLCGVCQTLLSAARGTVCTRANEQRYCKPSTRRGRRSVSERASSRC